MLTFDLQGGGLYILSGGTATLINSNIYSNTASSVRARLCVMFHGPDGTLRARVFFYLQGGGLYIVGTATLTNTNVYSNEARYVRWPSALVPGHFLHRPAEMLTVAICVVWQFVSFPANRTHV